MPSFKVLSTKNINRRVAGSVSFFDGTVDMDGAETAIRIQTKLSDEGASEVRVEKGEIFIPDVMMDGVRAYIESERQKQLQVEKEKAHLEAKRAEARAFLMDRLVEIEAVSEKQKAYAATVRIQAIDAIVERVGHPDKRQGLERELTEAIYERLVSISSARYWLDRGSYWIFDDLRKAVNKAHAEKQKQAA